MKNIKWDSPKIKIKEGRYRYLSLPRLYNGAIICKKGNKEIKNKKNIIKKKGNCLLALKSEKNENNKTSVVNIIQKILYGSK